MSLIFISYRRQDARGDAGRLADDLQEAFGDEQVFRDIDAIEAGVDFVQAIDEAVGSSKVLLALIGPSWATESGGRRRLDDPHDFVRLEIVSALERKIRVIPVLVGEAKMPTVEELPEPMAPLGRHQAHEVSDKRWKFRYRSAHQNYRKSRSQAAHRPSRRYRQDQPQSHLGERAAHFGYLRLCNRGRK